MNEDFLIFGRTWETIQAMQQATYKTPGLGQLEHKLPTATKEDDRLWNNGIEEPEKKESDDVLSCPTP
jgi:hypothetical protein